MGLYNFESTKVQINYRWNLEKLESLLKNYKDRDMVAFLKYGWLISHDGTAGSTSVPKNWPGAYQNHSEIRKYFEDEANNKAVLGPFTGNPFSCEAYISPLNTRNKKTVMKNASLFICNFQKGIV